LDDLILAHHSPDGLHDLYANRDYVRIDPNMRLLPWIGMAAVIGLMWAAFAE
jgi:hypothetical protein